MKTYNLKGLDIDALLTLRGRIDGRLTEERKGLQAKLARIQRTEGTEGSTRHGAHPSKGAKVPPKYRGPEGETWAGRGAQPRWLIAALKAGKKREDFLIDKSMAKPVKTRGRSAKRRAKA
jgi:DNA-binding protein H-NS